MAHAAPFANKRCIVTGANRGIGLALTKALLEQGASVYAGVRQPKAAEALQQLAVTHEGKLTVLGLDVSKDEAVQQFAEKLPQDGIDLLINNAGVNLDGGHDVTNVSGQIMLDSFNSNTVGPLRLTQHLLGRLHRRKGSKVANISSIMGSVGENAQGGVVAYRASKSALNMVTKCLALADDKVVYLTMHPGWVHTRMGGDSAPLDPTESAAGLLAQIAAADSAASGTFVRFDGKPAGW